MFVQFQRVQPVALRVHAVAGGAGPAHELHAAAGGPAGARAAAAIAHAALRPARHITYRTIHKLVFLQSIYGGYSTNVQSVFILCIFFCEFE